jgi:hypothetical protein
MWGLNPPSGSARRVPLMAGTPTCGQHYLMEFASRRNLHISRRRHGALQPCLESSDVPVLHDLGQRAVREQRRDKP